jgi:hypothetical protein
MTSDVIQKQEGMKNGITYLTEILGQKRAGFSSRSKIACEGQERGSGEI